MRLDLRSRLISAVVATAVLAVPTAIAASDQPGKAPNDPYGLRDDPRVQQALEEQRDREARRKAFRESDEGRRARGRSREAHRDASKAEALALVRDQFGDAFEAEPLHGLELGDGERVERYVGDDKAIVSRDGEKPLLAVSSFPLRTEKDGDLAPTDLRLEHAAGGFATRNAPRPVEVSDNLADGVRLPGLLALKPLQVSPSATAELVNGKAFFANSSADTDMWVEARAGGAEIYTQIRSPQAPSVQVYEVELPERARLKAADGSEAVVVERDGETIATVAPPVAFDADGERVPMRYRVAGSRLLVTVDHRGGDFRYPILADPLISDNTFNSPVTAPSTPLPTDGINGWDIKENPDTSANPWGFDYRDGSPFGRASWGTGLWIWDIPGGDYKAGNSGEWLYKWNETRARTSYIARLDAHGADFDPRMNWGVTFTCLYFGMWAPSRTDWDGYQFRCDYNLRGWSPSIQPAQGTTGNHATMLDWTSRDGSSGTQSVAQVDRMVVYLEDPEAPTATINSHSVPPSTWGENGNRTVTVTGSDPGLGVRTVEVRVPSTASPQSLPNPPTCDGIDVKCDPPKTEEFTYSLGGLPEGTSTATARAVEPGGDASADVPWNLKIDRSNPVIGTPSGSLGTNGAWVKEGTQDLHVPSNDAYSGVQQSQISIGPSLEGLDRFTRTTSGGWAAGAQGGSWSVVAGSAANFSVNGSEGQIVSPQNLDQTIALPSLSLRDAEAAIDVRFPSAGGDYRPTLSFRRTSGGQQYSAVLVRDAAGKIWIRLASQAGFIGSDIDPGLVYASGDVFRLKASVSGASPTTFKAKVWKVGKAEPGWLVSRTDSTGPQVAGNPALRLLTMTAGAPTVAFDNYSISTLSSKVRDTMQNKKADGSAAPCDAASGCKKDPTHDFTWDPANEMEGPHTFTAHVNDPLGHAPADRQWTVNVDTQAPGLASGPSGSLWSNNGKFIREGSYVLDASAFDSASGVKEIKVLVNGNEEDAANAAFSCSPSCPATAPRHFVFDAGARPGGPYTVEMVAYDRVGHPTTIAKTTVRVDKVDPVQNAFTGSIAPPAAPAATTWVKPGTHSVTHSPTDDYSGIRRDSHGFGYSMASDDFGRTASGSWGTADSGGTWTDGGSVDASTSVDGSAGIVSAAQGQFGLQYLDGSTARDVDERVKVRMPNLSLDGSGDDAAAAMLVARRSACSNGAPDGCHLRAGMLVKNNGKIYLRGGGPGGAESMWPDIDTGLTFSAGETYGLRLRVVGVDPTTVQAKVWRVSSGEPAAWGVTRSGSQLGTVEQVAGHVGVRAAVASGATTNVRFDEFRAERLNEGGTYAPACSASGGCSTSPGPRAHNMTVGLESEGRHQLVVSTIDAVDHAIVRDWYVGIDGTPPVRDGTASGSLPANDGNFVPDGKYELRATARDDLSGIKDVKVFVNGVEDTAAAKPQNCSVDCPRTAPGDYVFDTTGRPENTQYRVEMVARDRLDQPVTLAAATVKLDRSDPQQGTYTGTGAPPAPGAPRKWLKAGSYSVTHTPTDNYSGVMRDRVAFGNQIASDSFSRTAAAGWNYADSGGGWKQGGSTGGTSSTDGSVGIMNIQQGLATTGVLDGNTPRDVDARVKVAAPAVTPDGTNELSAMLVARWTACTTGPVDGKCHLRAGMVIKGNGKIVLRGGGTTGSTSMGPDVDTGLTFSPADAYVVRLRVTGVYPTTVQAKVWKEGTPEPAAWPLTRTGAALGPVEQVPGRVGVRVSSSMPGTKTLRFDEFRADDVTPTTSYAPTCDAASGCPTNPGPQTFTWNAATAPEGRHQVVAATVDPVDHAVVQDWELWLDRSFPSTGGRDGALAQRDAQLQPGVHTLSFDAKDAVSGVKRVDFLVDGVNKGFVNGACTPDQCRATEPASFSWDSTATTGRHTIGIRVEDLAGHVYEDSWPVTIDAGPPTIELSGSMAPPLATGRTLHVKGDDADTGVKRLQLWLDPDQNPNPKVDRSDPCIGGCPRPVEFDYALPPGTTTGVHTIRVLATDGTGRTTEREFDVRVVDLLPASRAKLGLEHWFQYDDVDAGGDSNVYVNAETGNAVWHSVPIVNRGRGLSAAVNLTYNSQDRGGILGSTIGHNPVVDVYDAGLAEDLPGLSYGQAGIGFSIAVSGPTRLNEPLGGVLLAQAKEEQISLPGGVTLEPGEGDTITLTDADGTVHTFTRGVGGRWIAPPGVNMHLRRYRGGNATSVLDPVDDKWAMTRPDGVTHFFDNLGYLTSTRDRNGNELTYEYESYDAITGKHEVEVDNGNGTTTKVAACDGLDLGIRKVSPATGASVVCGKRVVKVVAPGSTGAEPREMTVHYKTEPIVAADYGDPANDPYGTLRHAWYRSAEIVGGNAGQIDHIVDAANRRYEFKYDSDGFLEKFTEVVGADKPRVTDLKYETWEQGVAGVGQDRQLTEIVPMDGTTALPKTVIRYVHPSDRRAAIAATPGIAKKPREVCGITPRNDAQEDLEPVQVAGEICRTAANDRETTYEYERDADGRTTHFSATDILNRGGEGQSATTATTTSELDQKGRPIEVTDPLLTKTALHWKEEVNAADRIETAAGTDDAAALDLEYETQHGTGMLLSQTKYPDWPSTAGARKTSFEYRFSNGTIHSLVDGDVGGMFVADLMQVRKPRTGTGSSFDVDPKGNVTTRWNRPDQQGSFAMTAYDSLGRITQEIDEVGDTTKYGDATAPNGGFTPGGNPTHVIDARGEQWDYTYDVNENVKSIADPRATDRSGDPDAAYTATLTYDSFDRLTHEKAPKLSAGSDPGERFTTKSLTYDRDGNVQTDFDGIATTNIDYTPAGNPQTVDAPGGAQGREVTRYVYDDASRLIARVDPKGGSAGATADGQVSACTGAAAPPAVAYMTRFCLDAAGRRVAQVRSSTRPGDDPLLITSYAFDRRDNQVAVVDPERNGATSVAAAVAAAGDSGADSKRRLFLDYNKVDERTDTYEYPTGGAAALRTHVDYDANGNRERSLPPRAYSEGPADDYATTWYHDLQDQVIAQRDPKGCTAYARRGDGSLASVTTPRGTEGAGNCALDGAGNPQEYTHFTTKYEYDGGLVASRSIPYAPSQYDRSDAEFAKWKVTYWRDAVGNPARICDARTNAASSGEPCDAALPEPPAAGIRNTFYDTGELASTTRPSFYRLNWGDAHANPRVGAHYTESGSRTDLELADGGPALEEAGNVSRTAARSRSNPKLPTAREQGKFAKVERHEPGDMLPDAGATNFTYDDAMRLRTIADAAGAQRVIDYDDRGRVTGKRWPFNGNETTSHTYEYDVHGNLDWHEDSLGHRTTFAYDGYDRRVEEMTPGSLASPEDQTANRQKTTFTYDRNSNVESRVTPRGGLTFRFGYDSLDRMVREKDPTGAQWTYGYNANGQPVCTSSPNAGSDECDGSSPFATRVRYDAADRIERVTDGLGGVTTYDYDADGNLEETVTPGAGSHAGGSEVRRRTATDHDGRGLPWRTTISSEDGSAARTTLQEYDPNGNLRRVVNPSGVGSDRLPLVADQGDAGDAAWHATVRDYDANDQLRAIHLPWSTEPSPGHPAVEDPQGPSDPEAHGDDRRLVQRFRRDATFRDGDPNPLLRVTSVVAPHEADDDNAPRTSYTYFDNGWAASQTEERGVDPATPQGTGSLDVSYDYTREGDQKTWRTRHAGATTDGRRVERIFNDDGTLRERVAIKPLPGGDGDIRRTYRYGYNANRSLTAIFDYPEQTRQDDSDPVKAPVNPRKTLIERDDAEREHVVNEAWAGGRDSVFTYDANGNVETRLSDRRREDDGSYTGTKETTFEYDALDRERSNTVDPADGPNRTTETTWWPSGDMHTRTKHNGTIERRYFDVQAQIEQKTRDPQVGDTETQDYEYDIDGNRTGDERGTHAFNPRGQLVEWTRGSKYDSQAVGKDKVGTKVTYTRTDGGDVASKTDEFNPNEGSPGAITTTFTYKGERLETTQTTTPTQLGAQHARADYSYDDFGSVKKIETKTSGPGVDPPPPPDGVESPAVCSEVPDEAETHVTRYCFDEFERMVLSRGAGVKEPTRYKYDALDRRDTSTVEIDGEPKRHDLSYLGTSRLLSRETTAEGDLKTYDYDSQGHRLNQAVRKSGAPAGEDPRVRAYATDANGSVEGLENGDGKFGGDGKDTYLYDPYGEDEKVAPPGADATDPDAALSDDAKDNPFRYEGFYFDSGVKSYDMQAREYRPDSGRFLSADRFESAVADQVLQADPLTQNRYAFAGGNPVNRVEFDGHDSHANVSACQARGGSGCYARGAEYDRQQAEAAAGTNPPAGGGGGGTSSSGGSPGGAAPSKPKPTPPPRSLSSLVPTTWPGGGSGFDGLRQAMSVTPRTSVLQPMLSLFPEPLWTARAKWVESSKEKKSGFEEFASGVGDTIADGAKFAWKHRTEIVATAGIGVCIVASAGTCAAAGLSVTLFNIGDTSVTCAVDGCDPRTAIGAIGTDLVLGAMGPLGRSARELSLLPKQFGLLHKEAREAISASTRTKLGQRAIQAHLNAPFIGMQWASAHYWRNKSFGPSPAPPPPSPAVPPLLPPGQLHSPSRVGPVSGGY